MFKSQNYKIIYTFHFELILKRRINHKNKNKPKNVLMDRS